MIQSPHSRYRGMIKTHLVGFRYNVAACSCNIYPEQGTHDPEEVDCLACRRTLIWKALRGPEEETPMMTFNEAYESLMHRRGMDVVKELEHWHPAALGELLRAIAMAKSTHYPGGIDRDYFEGAVKVVESAGPGVGLRRKA